MAFQRLLHLPVCLRRQAFAETLSRKAIFSFRQDSGAIVTRRALGNTPKGPKRAAPQRPSASSPPRRVQPPSASKRPPQPVSAKARSYWDLLFDHGDEILLYRSPNQRSFILISTTIGAGLLLGSYNWSILVLKQPPGEEVQKGAKRWFLVSVSMAATFFMAVMATAALLAPAAVIKSIAVRAAAAADGVKRPILMFKVRNLPFERIRTIEATPSQAFLDQKVSAVDIDLMSVPLKDAKAFTESAQMQAPRMPTQLQTRNAFGRAWETLKRDVGRTFVRDGFAYVRLTDGGRRWKLDLQHCQLLDEGRPLTRLTTPESEERMGFLRRLMRLVST